MDFVAIDVETANADAASICQIGIVAFENGSVKESWQSLVNPEDYFDGVNISIHGIDQDAVKRAPTFPGIYESVRNWLAGSIVACHTPFDRVAVVRVAEKYGLEQVACAWLDTARVARRAWPQFSKRGYGLANVARQLGISFVAHNAEEDARAAGELLVHAMKETGMAISEWQERVREPISPSRTSKGTNIATGGNPEGDLYGETVVFTGALTIPRRLAAQIAAEAGCKVLDSVGESTTLLVVGDQDIRRLAGHEKSSKHRKAEGLIARGQTIRILGESDFTRLVGLQDSPQ
ncbi:MAG: exonuclease domain-containing protein [Dehalococcoidia bacterium]|jgi:DNA polymerase-3 subunit epsilon